MHFQVCTQNPVMAVEYKNNFFLLQKNNKTTWKQNMFEYKSSSELFFFFNIIGEGSIFRQGGGQCVVSLLQSTSRRPGPQRAHPEDGELGDVGILQLLHFLLAALPDDVHDKTHADDNEQDDT